MNTVAVAAPPVLVMTISVMRICRAIVAATVRDGVMPSAVVRADCRRMTYCAVGFIMCSCPILGGARMSGRQRYHDAKQGQHSGNSSHVSSDCHCGTALAECSSNHFRARSCVCNKTVLVRFDAAASLRLATFSGSMLSNLPDAARLNQKYDSA